MSTPIDRLRAADPAAGLGSQPDERAEADLRLLLAESQAVPAAVPRSERRRLTPILVTAVVALVIIAGTVTALTVVHPRARVAAPDPTSSVSMIAPPYLADDCAPQKVLPFQCGTYRSVFGGSAVTGDTGGPAKDPLSMSFTTVQGVLLMTVVSKSCFAAAVPVRSEGGRLVRAGELLVGQSATCTGGRGLHDAGHWANAFLRGSLDVDASGGGGLVFGSGPSMVTFEYQGAASIGDEQLPRNDSTCVAAHVAPFACGAYGSTTGSGTLGFLATSPYTLRFQHVDGELTAELGGGCNGMSVVIEPEPGPAGLVVAIPGGSTLALCPGTRGAHDRAVSAFLRGELTATITDRSVTFTKGASSATFQR